MAAEFAFEVLPLALGTLVGIGTYATAMRRRRWALPCWLAGCLLAGPTASAVNGELGGRWWALFVSYDTLVVAAASVAVFMLAVSRRLVTTKLR
jgi:hypothetical protein